MKSLLYLLSPLWLLCGWLPAIAADTPLYKAETLQQISTFDARQGVAVDRQYFYAVNNFRITKHARDSGEPLLQWDGESDETGPLVHLDSGMVWQGKLYAAHSNYPQWPMTSSVEVWDTETMQHQASYSFGIALGSLTWVDRHGGYWWAGFGNYDKIQKGQSHPYGDTGNTRVVKLDDQFRVLEQWTIPEGILQRLRPMSNSGGSWGPDNLLYLTGHDHPEIYVMQLPRHGTELEWLATVSAPEIHGQGIAWDRSSVGRELWAIRKRDRQVFRLQIPQISRSANPDVSPHLRAPGQFSRD
ncbi:hypothetical protein [uncultured Microbulbifer sp.]|uniref:hypothetical protein n=1 Tax=uncultured Microbulbifer sp. TaxID=348147 RepID=UPI0025F86BED|nr:hypothetical protein [uncultured Microbulbifer sp.]